MAGSQGAGAGGGNEGRGGKGQAAEGQGHGKDWDLHWCQTPLEPAEEQGDLNLTNIHTVS